MTNSYARPISQIILRGQSTMDIAPPWPFVDPERDGKSDDFVVPFLHSALGRENKKDRFHAVNDIHPSSYRTDWSTFRLLVTPSTVTCDQCDPVCTNCFIGDPNLCTCTHGLSPRQDSTCETCNPSLTFTIRAGRSVQAITDFSQPYHSRREARRTARNGSAASQSRRAADAE